MPGTQRSTKPYLSVIQGSIRQTVDQGTDGAVRRDYETSKGAKGTKYELVYDTWTGVITKLEIRQTDYGQQLSVHFDDAILTIGTNHRMFNSLIEKLPNADLAAPVTLAPYDFEDQNGKRISGLNLLQGGKKLESFYVRRMGDTRAFANGYPNPGEGVKSKNEWKKHFMDVEDFLVKEVTMLQDRIEQGNRHTRVIQDDEIPTIYPDSEEISLEDIEDANRPNLSEVPF